MTYTIHTLVQGSPEWRSYRADCYNASELALAMGYTMNGLNRTDLIRKLATGIEPEITPFQQRLFDEGHRFEALARPLAEKIIGRELFPITASTKVDGLALRLSASFDGATDEDVPENFEHKMMNAELSAALDRSEIPEEYWPQMEQGQLVDGALKTLFMASKWEKAPGSDEEPGRVYGWEYDEHGEYCRYVLVEEKHCWYESRPELRAKIIPTWRQIEADVLAYVPQEVIQAAVAAPVEGFGALVLQVEGRVLSCNIDAFKADARAFLDRLPKAEVLSTDQGFADAEAAAKACAEAESRIKSAKDAAMAQAASIDTVFRAVDLIAEEIRAARLTLERAVKTRKEAIREEIAAAGRKALADHVAALNARIGKPYMPSIMGDFAVVINGKKTVQSLRDAVDTELARCKISANEIADRIQINLNTLVELASDHKALFPDAATLVLKANDDLRAVIATRIAEHRAAEEKRLEAERESIRAEEQARAEREQNAQAAQAVQAPSGGQPQEPAVAAPTLGQVLHAAAPAEIAAIIAPHDTGARLKLGEINAAIAPLSVTADGLRVLGFEPVGAEKNAKIYRAQDLPMMCAAMVRHLQQVAVVSQELRRAA